MRFVPVAAIAAILLGVLGSSRGALAGTSSGQAPKTAIFVANLFDVTAFPLAGKGDISPLALTTDFASPSGIARDSSGRLYVTNLAANTVTIFDGNASGDVRPLAVIGGPHTRLAYPGAIVVGGDGTIYVANRTGRSGGAVTVYPSLDNNAGILDEPPIAEIAGSKTLLDQPTGIALDSHGNIYVADEVRAASASAPVGRITAYAAASKGNATPIAAISGDRTGLAFPVGIALDSSDNIYVFNAETAKVPRDHRFSSPSVTVYPAGSVGNAAPSATIAGSNTSLFTLGGGIAVDSAGNIYATGCANTNGKNGCFSINVFPAGSNGNVSPGKAIFDVDVDPQGIAVDPNRNVYLLNAVSDPIPGGEILIYPAASSGNATPSATIYDNFTALGEASGIALDSAGTIYVADPFAGGDGNGSINAYAAGSYAAGVPPVSAITGPDAGLDNPRAVALDSSGAIFALNFGYISKHAPGSMGDAVPEAVFPSTRTFTGLAVNPSGKLYATVGAGFRCHHGSCHQTDSGKILIWPAGSKGSSGPTNVISGPDTGLTNPSAIAVDDNGTMYVANEGHFFACNSSCAPSVTVYSAQSVGDAPPTATIAGPHTGFVLPNGIALDASGSIYVLDAGISFAVTITQTQRRHGVPVGGSVGRARTGRNRILIFPAGSKGDVAPIGSIGGGFTGFVVPLGIAIGPTGL